MKKEMKKKASFMVLNNALEELFLDYFKKPSKKQIKKQRQFDGIQKKNYFYEINLKK